MPIKYLLRNMLIVFFLHMISITGMAFASTGTASDQINFQEIIKYANLSRAAYQSVPSLEKFSSLKNYSISHYGNLPGYKISYFIATNDIEKIQVISVRGTNNPENALVDVAFQLITDKHTGLRLHNGFSQTASAIYEEIRPLLKQDYLISTTGHSLGGAVALILAIHMDVDKFTIGEVITFGQPKVTNIAGANKLQHLKITRVVMQKDLVPLMPPFDPVDMNNIDIYWHAGKEIILLDGNTYAIAEGMKSMMRTVKFTQEPLGVNNIQNHKISIYVKSLANKIPTAIPVPLKSDLNLFNLFK